MEDQPETELLFTEEEWNAAMPSLVTAMTTYLRPYRTAVFEDLGDHGQGWGSGSYLRLGDAVHLLTNEHVTRVRRSGRQLAYQFNGQDDIRRVVGNHREFPAPLDLGLLPVHMPSWDNVSNGSKAITIDQIAMAHAPAPTEVLAFAGFAGQRVSFNFGQLNAESTCYLAREVEVPEHHDIDPRFHFALVYNPDLATTVVGSSRLPTPNGFSGSTVWDTGFVRAKMKKQLWTPDMARVTGVVWGWPSGAGSIVATRAEYVRSFLLGAVTPPAIPDSTGTA
ncbi:hypothetical protein [Caballeronia sp. AZ1_KS37]|uniref:hypothetical protein n=1 Tax=Caballeronia sp. AZ1_KS37 TaxID=2921756 RepID=UPI002028BAF6|nr:hypothetical protein [Caballeronia sp. AZ1_KS37]